MAAVEVTRRNGRRNVDYDLLTFEGYHFAHIKARAWHERRREIDAETCRAYESACRQRSR
jgi:hypothetical protein